MDIALTAALIIPLSTIEHPTNVPVAILHSPFHESRAFHESQLHDQWLPMRGRKDRRLGEFWRLGQGNRPRVLSVSQYYKLNL
jgi:hypothetical protein